MLLDTDGNEMFGGDYTFTPGKDDVVREAGGSSEPATDTQTETFGTSSAGR
jgi:hypothetical protein